MRANRIIAGALIALLSTSATTAQDFEFVTKTLVPPVPYDERNFESVHVNNSAVAVIDQTSNRTLRVISAINKQAPIPLGAINLEGGVVRFSGLKAYVSDSLSFSSYQYDNEYGCNGYGYYYYDTCSGERIDSVTLTSQVVDFSNWVSPKYLDEVSGRIAFEHGADVFMFQSNKTTMWDIHTECSWVYDPYCYDYGCNYWTCWTDYDFVGTSKVNMLAGPADTALINVYGRDVAFDGNIALIVGEDKLQSAQLLSDGSLLGLATIDLPGKAFEIVRNGVYAYVLGEDYLAVVVARHPLNMRVAAYDKSIRPGPTLSKSSTHMALTDDGHLAVVNQGGVSLYDLSQPTELQHINRYEVESYPVQGIAAFGSTLYVVGNGMGLHIVDASNITSPALLGQYPPAPQDDTLTATNINDVVVRDERSYVASGSDGLIALDLSTMERPEITGTVGPKPLLELRENREHDLLYYCDARYVRFFDLTQPGEPQLGASALLTRNPQHTVTDCEIVGGTAYITHTGDPYTGGTWFKILDISEPSLPVTISQRHFLSAGQTLTMSGQYAYLHGNRPLVKIDVSDPTAPDVVHELDLRAEFVIADRQFLYCAGSNRVDTNQLALRVYDYTIPVAPYQIYSAEFPSRPMSMKQTDNELIIGAGQSGVYFFDVSIPYSMYETSHLTTSDPAINVSVDGALVAVTTLNSLLLYRRSIETMVSEEGSAALPDEFTLEQNYPNPFNPKTSIRYALPERSDVTLEVFNVKGQLVDRLIDGSQSAGVYTVEWNAENLASGVYFYRLTGGGIVSTRKMVLLK